MKMKKILLTLISVLLVSATLTTTVFAEKQIDITNLNTREQNGCSSYAELDEVLETNSVELVTKKEYNFVEKCINYIFKPVFLFGKRLYGDGSGYGILGLGFWNPSATCFLDWFYTPWTTTSKCIQKLFGYSDNIDNIADKAGCIIEHHISMFEYNNKWYRVQLWKGKYGINIGMEMGIYTLNHAPTAENGYWHRCSRKNYEMKSVLTLNKLYENNAETLKCSVLSPDYLKKNNSAYTGTEVNDWWWGTQFIFDITHDVVNDKTLDIGVITKIDMKDKQFAKICAENFDCFDSDFSVYANGTEIVLIWSDLITDKYCKTDAYNSFITVLDNY